MNYMSSSRVVQLFYYSGLPFILFERVLFTILFYGVLSSVLSYGVLSTTYLTVFCLRSSPTVFCPQSYSMVFCLGLFYGAPAILQSLLQCSFRHHILQCSVFSLVLRCSFHHHILRCCVFSLVSPAGHTLPLLRVKRLLSSSHYLQSNSSINIPCDTV